MRGNIPCPGTLYALSHARPAAPACRLQSLKKPGWTPPNWVFPAGGCCRQDLACPRLLSLLPSAACRAATGKPTAPPHPPTHPHPTPAAVWIPLKLLQSVALWLVWRSGADQQQLAVPLSLFGLHLFLGNWWNVSARPAGFQGAVACTVCVCTRVHAAGACCGCRLSRRTPRETTRGGCLCPPSPRQVVFFGRHKLEESLGWMGAFWASIAASIASFWQASRQRRWRAAFARPMRCALMCTERAPAEQQQSGTGGSRAVRFATPGCCSATALTPQALQISPRPAALLPAGPGPRLQVAPLAALLFAPTQVCPTRRTGAVFTHRSVQRFAAPWHTVHALVSIGGCLQCEHIHSQCPAPSDHQSHLCCPAWQVWVSIAAKLNYDIVRLNRGSSGGGGSKQE